MKAKLLPLLAAALLATVLRWPDAPFGLRGNNGTAEAHGSPYLNNQYWPNWAYLPLAELPAYNCTSYYVDGGIIAWDRTGLVNIGSAATATDCTGYQRLNFEDPADPGWCAVCQGQVHPDYVTTPSRNPETSGIGYLQLVRSTVHLKAGLQQLGPTTVAHELGHVIGLRDQYDVDQYGNPYCSGTVSLMDICGYTTPQQQDSDWVRWAYQRPPFSPDGLNAWSTAFNRVSLSWTDRSHNERQFRIERSVNGGGWTFVGNAGRDSGSWGDTTQAATNSCYRVRAENDWSAVGPWVNSPCPTTPDAVGVVSGVISGYNITMCAGHNVTGVPNHPNTTGATSFKFLTFRWSTSQAITRTVGNNENCYGAVLWTGTLAQDYWHLAVAGCNAYGCSGYRDMTNPNQYWTAIPDGACCAGGANPNYHSH